MAKGLGDMMGLKGNGLYDWFDSNRDTIGDFAGGFIGQGSTEKGLKAGMANVDKLAPYRQEQAQRNEQIAQATEQKNKTMEFLQQKHPDLAQAVGSGLPIGDAFGEAFRRDVPGYGAAKPIEVNGQLIDPKTFEVLGDFRTPGAGKGGNVSYGVTPIWGSFEDGTSGYGVQGSDGSFKRVETGGFQPMDPRTINSERAAGSAFGKQLGGDQYGLPDTIAKGEQAIQNLFGLLPEDAQGKAVANPGFEDEFGSTFMIPNSRLPVMDRTPRADFHSRLDQVQGQSFLQGIEQMKGTGAISEAEGSKAAQAVMRASTAQTREAFIASVKEAITIIQTGLERARSKAAAGQGSTRVGPSGGFGTSNDPLGLGQ